MWRLRSGRIVSSLRDRAFRFHSSRRVNPHYAPALEKIDDQYYIEAIDGEKCQLHLIGRGQDTKGTSLAEMDLTARVVDIGEPERLAQELAPVLTGL